jgi:hypothetical protein
MTIRHVLWAAVHGAAVITPRKRLPADADPDQLAAATWTLFWLDFEEAHSPARMAVSPDANALCSPTLRREATASDRGVARCGDAGNRRVLTAVARNRRPAEKSCRPNARLAALAKAPVR